MASDDKYIAFRNFIYNELGITKEEIRQWIMKAVDKQAELMVKNTFGRLDVDDALSKHVSKQLGTMWGWDKALRSEVADKIAQRIQIQVFPGSSK